MAARLICLCSLPTVNFTSETTEFTVSGFLILPLLNNSFYSEVVGRSFGFQLACEIVAQHIPQLHRWS